MLPVHVFTILCPIIVECTLSTYKNVFAVRQDALLHEQQPHRPPVYYVSRWHPFLLCLIYPPTVLLCKL